jgi:lyso-ornithine lipid O-acyltransferase
MGALRAGSILSGFLAITVPLMPVQALLVRVSPRLARKLPQWYHRQVCRLVGVRLKVEGEVAKGRPVLLVANHTSWLDIPVLSAVAPVSFVAKKEVSRWPFVSALARLQRSVFVDRERRSAVGASTSEILARLNAGDAIVLFAEGTSSDGNRVLPFKSSLFAAAKPPDRLAPEPSEAVVQTLSIVYMRLCGIPLGRNDRPRVGWYGGMELQGHAWELLKAGPLDVEVRIGPPVSLDCFADRKELARHTEGEVRANVIRRLRQRPPHERLEVAAPRQAPQEGRPAAAVRERSMKWV